MWIKVEEVHSSHCCLLIRIYEQWSLHRFCLQVNFHSNQAPVQSNKWSSEFLTSCQESFFECIDRYFFKTFSFQMKRRSVLCFKIFEDFAYLKITINFDYFNIVLNFDLILWIYFLSPVVLPAADTSSEKSP